MSLRTTTSYSRALAVAIIIVAAIAAPQSFAIIGVLPARPATPIWCSLFQNFERVAKPRRIRAVFLPLRPDIDHHVDAVARRHHLDLVRRIAGIGNTVDTGLPGDGSGFARAQGR